MDGIWSAVWVTLGVVALMLVIQLMDLPEWLANYFKNRVPRQELEQKVLDMERRIAALEEKIR